MKKSLLILLLFTLSLFADNHERRVTFSVNKSYQTSASCRVIGNAPYVIIMKDKSQKTVAREYSILTKANGCPQVKEVIQAGSYTCTLSKVTRELEMDPSRLEGEGWCRRSHAPDPEYLKEYCKAVPSDKVCK